MIRFTRPVAVTLFALAASAAFASRSIAPPTFDQESVQRHQGAGRLSMVMWYSTTMFIQRTSATMDPASARQLAALLDGYAIFALVDARMDADASALVSQDHGRMRASATLQLGDRAPLAVVPEQALPEAVRVAVQAMRPMMVGTLGKLGEAVEFVVFKDGDKQGRSLMVPDAHLVATLRFDDETFVWRLPAISLQPVRLDRATGDTFPADYEFSPFTGHKLEATK